ncbi:MAG: cytochrome c maturation protein CcmE [Cellvibrionaceae bacterium]|nr:cytochrome c maturation protein CcmE [Cellvibrionaceae bacterium]
MNTVRKQRLMLVMFIVAVSTLGVGLTVYAMRENMNYFYPPSKILAGDAPMGRSIRAGGCVVPGTVERADDSLLVRFDVTDGIGQISVTFDEILPDLFAEGEAVVLTGMLDREGVFVASKVLAKHDEQYTPPEVADTLQVDDTANHTAKCKGMSYDS